LKEVMALGTAGFTSALGIERRMLENHHTPGDGPNRGHRPLWAFGGVQSTSSSAPVFSVTPSPARPGSDDY